MDTKLCPHCRVVKQVDDFSFKNKSRGVRQWWCRSCDAAYKLRWYSANRERHMTKVRAGQKKTTAEHQARMWSFLAQHPCVDCGESNPVVLEFDHIRDKRANVSSMTHAAFAWATIEAEIAKCEVRCANCHRIKTARERGIYERKSSPQIMEAVTAYTVLRDN